LGVPRQLAGQVFRSNLFIGEKPLKRISTSTLNANSLTIANFIPDSCVHTIMKMGNHMLAKTELRILCVFFLALRLKQIWIELIFYNFYLVFIKYAN